MKRRSFLKTSARLGALSGLGFAALGKSESGTGPTPEPAAGEAPECKTGRLVRVVSIGFKQGRPSEDVTEWIEKEGSNGADVIALPETWRGQDERSQETLNGPAVTTMSSLARKHRTYIVCPIDRKAGQRRLNSVVLLDRKGEVGCTYDKIYPWFSEFGVEPAVDPGQEVPPVYQADFGRLGFATCFDVNFPEVWQRLSDQGAALVIWPSAYSGGRALQAHAINFHYYIVSSTQTPDCVVYDITARRNFLQQGSGGEHQSRNPGFRPRDL